MRLSTVCAAALSVTSVATALPGWLGSEQSPITISDEEKVPGENPLTFCDTDHSDDIAHIEKVDLSPNPPEAGTSLSISAVGTVSEAVEDGAYVIVRVKYGLITLIRSTIDLCEQTEKAEVTCPIEKGVVEIKKDVDIPKEVPPGKYTVHAEVYTKDDDPITCLNAVVTFGRKSNMDL